MENLFKLHNGNYISISILKGIIKFPGKGVALRNEFNKIVDFINEPNSDRQDIIAEALGRVHASGRNWKQVDWDAEFAKMPKPKASSATPAA